jgi:hypothetical protein
MTSMFPKPWRVEDVSSDGCGAFRIYDANDRQLFVITADDYTDEDSNDHQTVLTHGTDEEQTALDKDLEKLFEGFNQ